MFGSNGLTLNGLIISAIGDICWFSRSGVYIQTMVSSIINLSYMFEVSTDFDDADLDIDMSVG